MRTIRAMTVGLMVILVALLVLVRGNAVGQTSGPPSYEPGQVLVKFRSDVLEQALTPFRTREGLDLIRRFARTGIHHFRIQGAASLPQILARLRQSALVEYAEPNYVRQLFSTPNDPRYPEMWGLHNTGQTGGTPGADVHAPEAWEIQTGSPSVIVADLDSGIDLTHEDLAANLWTNPGEIPGNGIDDDGNGLVDDVHGWDFRDNDNDPTDTSPFCLGHGTHTAGTIGAVGNNGVGVTGVNRQVKIMPLRVFGGVFCSARDGDIIAAIEYYTGFGVRISNNSYGGGPASQAVLEAIRASHSLFVAAAGNGGLDMVGDDNDATPQYPASYDLRDIMAVAATDHNDQLAPFSNYGATSVDLGAPGVNILSTLPGNAYGYLSGTSMATPHVTGAAALLLAQDPTATPLDLKWRILRGVDSIGLPVLTGGRLNLARALQVRPEVAITIRSTGPTTVHPGENIVGQVTASNTATTPRTVTAAVVFQGPNGTERLLAQPVTSVLAAGASISIPITIPVPATVPPSLFGDNRLLVWIFTANFASFDEDQMAFEIAP